ncbi:MAG: hypothetical protein AB7F82_02180 [Alphaproteobacteria bacterium]
MKKSHILSLLLFTAACNEIPGEAYYNRGDPENLLDVSSEVVNMNLNSTASFSNLSRIVANDKPTRAEVNCDPSSTHCAQTYELFDHHGIPVESTNGPEGVTLVYERVVARDCENRYIDNSINPYNLHPLTFGCSVSANTVQMVSNKQQFTNPNLLDYRDGDKALQTYRVYLQPPRPQQEENENSLLSTISTQ